MAYDRAIVVFSPDGRILQVEYARQMVKNGSTALGIQVKDAVILGTIKVVMPLAVTESYRKIYEIDDHAAAVSSGSLADARDLIEMARVKGQVNKITYGEPISIASLTMHLCDRMHMVTQYAGVRPYGVGLLIAGVDLDGPSLYETEPSGTMIEWKAQAIGRGADKAKKLLEKEYKDGLELKAGIALLLKALKAAEKDVSKENVEVSVIRKHKVEKLTVEEIEKLL